MLESNLYETRFWKNWMLYVTHIWFRDTRERELAGINRRTRKNHRNCGNGLSEMEHAECIQEEEEHDVLEGKTEHFKEDWAFQGLQ